MSEKSILSRGWIRLATVISIFWILTSVVLYTSIVNEPFSNDTRDWPTWYAFFFETPFSKITQLYYFKEATNELCTHSCGYIASFDLFGFVFFALFPTIVIWVFIFSIAWVKDGFQSQKPKQSKSERAIS